MQLVAKNSKLSTINSQPSTVLLFAVPEHDHDEFQRLPEDVRAEVDRLLIEFEKVSQERFVKRGLDDMARRLNHLRGFKFGSLRRKYYLYVNGGAKNGQTFEPGDWRALVDLACCTKSQKGIEDDRDTHLPKDFLEYLKGLFQSNKRKSEPAIRLLYRQWRAGESIPGYGSWQEWFMDNHPHHPLPRECPPDLPRGWSRANLRRYIPEDAELALAREGISAAREYLPKVITTREGLRPLECIMFDDVRTDFKIIVPGYASPVEINLLVAIDVATGMILRFGLRPGIPQEDGTRDKLKLMDMKHLVAGIISTFGIPKEYVMHLIVENATAAIKEGFEMALRELSCDRIHVSRTMMIRGTAIWGGYMDKSLGNPNGKAPLESTFNLFHNEAAFLPGQTGRRYDEGPRELAGREEESRQLMRVSRHMTPMERAKLKLPFLDRDQARLVIAMLWNQIIHRTDHRMEAFELVGEWRAKDFDQWQPESQLVALNLDPATVQWRTPARMESPFERWERLVDLVGGKNAFSAMHPGAVCRLYDDHAPRTIECGEIVFRFGKETYVYRIANVQNHRRALQNEMEVLCYFDREDMSMIHVTDGEGGYLGSIPRTRGARRLDREEVTKQFEASRKARRELQDKVSKRMPWVAEEHLAQLENNNAVMEEARARQQAIDLAPSNPELQQSNNPEFSRQIGDVVASEKARIKHDADRSKALRTFKGDVDELAEQSKVQSPTSNVEETEELAQPATDHGQLTTDQPDLSAEGLL